jgi:site-specific recombinase XerD
MTAYGAGLRVSEVVSLQLGAEQAFFSHNFFSLQIQ